ncbi:PaaI family thioesterase [Pelomonas sp. SE-A7]|uniref:PaaI family thioesterase n=1 Tax=Pelomonas sp. SE-A7 TaxID=3054953 RepID=UPI00259CAA17|nr:PaaI family thioesterase [Pelomonas sp. SE-A7]MDM4765124.1 PaaI family thioesterase [Pelomonas sp. SE-A7]
MADEAAIREKRRGYGVARPDQVMGRSGLQLLEAMLAGELPAANIGETMDFSLISVKHGEAIFQGKPQRRHYNPMGSVHGGWYATLLDSALGCAVHTTMPVGRGYTTLEFKVNLVRALDERVPLVRAIGRVVHGGKQVATAEAELVGHDGRLYAHATTTCLIFDLAAKT